jgi:hypothetical protein
VPKCLASLFAETYRFATPGLFDAPTNRTRTVSKARASLSSVTQALDLCFNHQNNCLFEIERGLKVRATRTKERGLLTGAPERRAL